MNDRLLPLFSIRVMEMTPPAMGSAIAGDLGADLIKTVPQTGVIRALARAARQWVRRE
jgi:hypothetical protein